MQDKTLMWAAFISQLAFKHIYSILFYAYAKFVTLLTKPFDVIFLPGVNVVLVHVKAVATC